MSWETGTICGKDCRVVILQHEAETDVMIRRFSPAKINLLLRVGARLPNGYHELTTVMLPISLGDWLAVRRQPNGVTLEVHERFDFSGNSDAVSQIPTDERNLIVRIARGFLQHCQVSAGAHFVLYKSIPAGGGLGGASSNAAVTLLLLNELFELGWSWRKLAEFSADYGSDIAFFTQPQAAACYGRGEVVEPFSSPSTGWFVIVRPPFGLATPAVFAELAHERLGSVPIPNGSTVTSEMEQLIRELKCGWWNHVAGFLANDLQSPAVRLRPPLESVNAICNATYPVASLMTGSGSCWYSIYRHRRQAIWASNRLRNHQVGRVEVARSLAMSPMKRGQA